MTYETSAVDDGATILADWGDGRCSELGTFTHEEWVAADAERRRWAALPLEQRFPIDGPEHGSPGAERAYRVAFRDAVECCLRWLTMPDAFDEGNEPMQWVEDAENARCLAKSQDVGREKLASLRGRHQALESVFELFKTIDDEDELELVLVRWLASLDQWSAGPFEALVDPGLPLVPSSWPVSCSSAFGRVIGAVRDALPKPEPRTWAADECRRCHGFTSALATLCEWCEQHRQHALPIVIEHEPTADNFEPRLPVELLKPPGGSGLMQLFLHHVNRTAIYPQPEIELAGALALMATLTGRKVRDEQGTRTNCYLLCAAPSGSGKDFTRQCLKDVLREACSEALELLGPERLASHAGLISELRASSCKVFPLDECHRLLATTKDARSPHLFNIASLLLTFWSSAGGLWIGDAYGDRDKTPRIWCPHAVVFGSATAEGLWGSIDSGNLQDGLVARFCVFGGDYELPREVKPEQFPAELLERVRWWARFAPGGDLGTVNPEPRIITATPEAAARLFEHSLTIAKKRIGEDRTNAALWSRANEKARKFALLSACSRAEAGLEPSGIEFDDADWGVKLANHLTRAMLKQAGQFVAENPHEQRLKRLLRTISKPMSKSEISRASQWLTGRERDDLLRDLEEQGLIRRAEGIEGMGSGRRAIVYVPTTRKSADS